MNVVSLPGGMAVAVIALGTRILVDVLIDAPTLLSSGWIAALACCALTLPLVISMNYISKASKCAPAQILTRTHGRIFAAISALFLIYEAGSGISMLASSATYMSLEDSFTPLLFVISALVGLYVCVIGVRAFSATALLSVRLISATMVLVVIIQLNSFNVRWLTPIMGPGASAIASYLPGLCGMMTTLIPIWLMAQEGKPQKGAYMPKMLALLCVFTVAMTALYGMLMPPMPTTPLSRWFQLDRLLANGRTPQSLQVLMVPIWYSLLISAVSFMLLSAVHLLVVAWPSANRLVVSIIAAALAACIPFFELDTRDVIHVVNSVRWPVMSLPVIGYALLLLVRTRREART